MITQGSKSEHDMSAVASNLDASHHLPQLLNGDISLILIDQLTKASANDALKQAARDAPKEVRAVRADHAQHRTGSKIITILPPPLPDERRPHQLSELVENPPPERCAFKVGGARLPRGAPLAKERLDRVKCLLIHDGVMPALVGRAFVADQPKVDWVGAVRVTERSRKSPTLHDFRRLRPPKQHPRRCESDEVWIG